VLNALILAGCQSPVPADQKTPPESTQENHTNDIPDDVPPAIRMHLLKLREMRDNGQISNDDYQTRRNLLLKNGYQP
jgi:hypothetical protein